MAWRGVAWRSFLLLICHIFLPLVTVMILLSFLSEDVVILQQCQEKEWDVEGVLFGLAGLRLAGWNRGEQREPPEEDLEVLRVCSPSSPPFQPKVNVEIVK